MNTENTGFKDANNRWIFYGDEAMRGKQLVKIIEKDGLPHYLIENRALLLTETIAKTLWVDKNLKKIALLGDNNTVELIIDKVKEQLLNGDFLYNYGTPYIENDRHRVAFIDNQVCELQKEFDILGVKSDAVAAADMKQKFLETFYETCGANIVCNGVRSDVMSMKFSENFEGQYHFSSYNKIYVLPEFHDQIKGLLLRLHNQREVNAMQYNIIRKQLDIFYKVEKNNIDCISDFVVQDLLETQGKTLNQFTALDVSIEAFNPVYCIWECY